MTSTPSSPAVARPVPRVRSTLATVAALALVAAATLLMPTAASSQAGAAVDPADGPLYADGVVPFSGTCPEDPGVDWLDVDLTFSDPSYDRTTVASVDGVTWTAASGYLGSDEALTMTVSVDCSGTGEGPFAEGTFDLVAPSVALELTVGTVEGECATTSAIEVTAGTTVYWCYTVSSASARGYSAHTLVDDVDGTILDEEPYGLDGDGSVSSLELGLTLSDTATEDLVRTGTWTLLGCDGICWPIDDATASAQVTVLAEDDPAPTTTEVEEAPSPDPTPAPAPAAQPVPAAPTYTG